MYYSDKIHVFTVKLIPAFLPGRRFPVAKMWDCMWRLKMQKAFNAAASDLPCLLFLYQLAWKKGIEFSPAHCLPTKCFCFALAFALMKLFSFCSHLCGKEKSMLFPCIGVMMMIPLVQAGEPLGHCLWTDWESLGGPHLHLARLMWGVLACDLRGFYHLQPFKKVLFAFCQCRFHQRRMHFLKYKMPWRTWNVGGEYRPWKLVQKLNLAAMTNVQVRN